MYVAIDQRGVDMQPVRDNNRLWALYFITFLLIGAFFMLSLFIGVIVEDFYRLHEIKWQGLMTEDQRQWAATQQFVLTIRPEALLRRPTVKLRAIVYDFIMPGTNPWFDKVVIAIIIAMSFRNPPMFNSPVDPTQQQGLVETDEILRTYVQHPNTGEFHLNQRNYRLAICTE